MLRRISRYLKSKTNLWKNQENRMYVHETYYFIRDYYEYRNLCIEVVL